MKGEAFNVHPFNVILKVGQYTVSQRCPKVSDKIQKNSGGVKIPLPVQLTHSPRSGSNRHAVLMRAFTADPVMLQGLPAGLPGKQKTFRPPPALPILYFLTPASQTHPEKQIAEPGIACPDCSSRCAV